MATFASIKKALNHYKSALHEDDFEELMKYVKSDEFEQTAAEKYRTKYVIPLHTNMEVKLAAQTSSLTAVRAGRTSHLSNTASRLEDDLLFLQRIIFMGHLSVLEHITMTFYINGISRSVLQELVRHRIASYTVQSTRYTLKKTIRKLEQMLTPQTIIDEETGEERVMPAQYTLFNDAVEALAKEMINFTTDKDVNKELLEAAKRAIIFFIQHTDVPNDKLKYLLPEAWKTSLYMTINMRSFLNFLGLRLDIKALPEIRELAFRMATSVSFNKAVLIGTGLLAARKYGPFASLQFSHPQILEYLTPYTNAGYTNAMHTLRQKIRIQLIKQKGDALYNARKAKKAGGDSDEHEDI